MIRETGLKCVISGSFRRFKPEIDRTIEEFCDLGVQVLAPQTGWLYRPQAIITPNDLQFRPLPGEKGMSVREIENNFLRCLARADFHFIEDPEGYVGNSVALEIGFAYALGILGSARYHIVKEFKGDPTLDMIIDSIRICSPSELVQIAVKERDEKNLTKGAPIF